MDEIEATDEPPVSVRLPPDIREWLRQRADQDERSQSATIRFYLREAMQREVTATAE